MRYALVTQSGKRVAEFATYQAAFSYRAQNNLVGARVTEI